MASRATRGVAARSFPTLALLLAALLAYPATLPGARAAPTNPPKRSYGFRVRSHDAQPTFRRSLLRNATIPLHGAVKDYGYFYATLYLGTPPKKFAVIVDTGSTMTYVPCSSCGSGCGPNHQDAAFDPEASATAAAIPCHSPKCACGSPRCGCAAQHCTYTRSYAEQSSSSGVLIEDVLALHDGLPGAPIIFGCETRETGEIYKQRADGLFGLGNSDASVVNQLVRAGAIEDVFSLCFGMVEGDGALLLGDAAIPGTVELKYTPLLTSATHPFYYNVKMLSVAVEGQLLPVSQALFDQGYGTVLDSGTTFTYMPTPVFRAFAAAVEKHALSHGLRRVPGPDPQYDDICFGQAPRHDELEALSAVFPSMELTFDQGTSLILGPLNYLFVHTFNSGKYCLGVFDNGRAGTLLGGITFRNVLVRYDRANQRVGFGPAPCKELGEMQRPPCSYFEGNGGGSLAAATAAREGDCTMGPSRQQQETFDDYEEQQAADTTGVAAGGDTGGTTGDETAATAQQEEQPQSQPGSGGTVDQGRSQDASQQPQQQQAEEGSDWRRPLPGDQPETQAADSGSGASGTDTTPEQQQQQPEQQPEQPVLPATASGGGVQQQPSQEQDAVGPQMPEQQQERTVAPGRDAAHATAVEQPPGSDQQGNDDTDRLRGGLGVAVGLVVAVAAVLMLALAVALLQPAARERMRGAFSGRQYRSLEEDDQDPEGGIPLAPSAAGSGIPLKPAGLPSAFAASMAAGGGSAVGGEAVGTGALKSVELGPVGEPRPRGITTPTKLQRSASNAASEEIAVAASSAPTPRAGGRQG